MVPKNPSSIYFFYLNVLYPLLERVLFILFNEPFNYLIMLDSIVLIQTITLDTEKWFNSYISVLKAVWNRTKYHPLCHRVWRPDSTDCWEFRTAQHVVVCDWRDFYADKAVSNHCVLGRTLFPTRVPCLLGCWREFVRRRKLELDVPEWGGSNLFSEACIWYTLVNADFFWCD